MSDKTISQFYFGNSEHPNRQKMNDLLSVLEDTRRIIGVVSLTTLPSGQNTSTNYYVKLNESPYNLGGVYYQPSITGWLTRSLFRVLYDATNYTLLGTGDQDSFLGWKRVQFVSGTGPFAGSWYSNLMNSGSMSYGVMFDGILGTGAGQTNISGASITGFTCFRCDSDAE